MSNSMNWNELKNQVAQETLKADEYPLATVFRDKEGNKIVAADNAHVYDLDSMR